MRRAPVILAILLATTATRPARAQRGSAPPLDTVRVTSRASSAAATTRSVDLITREDLARTAGRSLAEVIGFALGADVQERSPAQADISLRGSTFNQVVILVDGIRVSDVQSGHYALDLALPVAMIERIEILRGMGSALYGSDAIGGVVNIVTRDDSDAATVSARGGSFGGASGGAALFTPLVRVGADVDRSDGHRPGTDYRVTQARLSVGHHVAGGRLTADVGQGLRQFGAADFYSPYPSDETTRSTTAALRYAPDGDARVSVAGSLQLRRHRDLFTLERDDPAFYQNIHLTTETGGELSARASVAPGVAAVVGTDLLDARLRSARLGDHDQRRTGAFGQLTLGDASHAVLDVGLRRDALSDQRAFTSPSIGAAVALGPSTRLRASVSRGFRAPTWTERYYVDPANISDSTLSVERFTAGEVGLRGVLLGALVGDVALYERRATDLIDWARPEGASATTPWRTRNFASARYRGVEASLRLPTLLGVDWRLLGSGLRFIVDAEPGTVGKYALRPITRSAGLGASAPVGAALLSVDARRERRAGEDDHLQLNARLSAPVGGLRATLDLVNLSGADYLDAAGMPVAGRSAFAGLSWSR